MSDRAVLIELAKAFIENELALASAYHACIGLIPEHEEAWRKLHGEELRHADAFRDILDAIETDHSLWAPGKFQAQTIHVMTNDILAMIKEIVARRVHPKYVVEHLIDSEHSLIETELTKSFLVEDREYQMLLSRLQEDTVEHRKVLQRIHDQMSG